ncbi:hypothetical protein PMAYCL1PPCAC_14118, partial [Pristionchus mayeri]
LAYMRRERALAMGLDPNKNDPLRYVVYGLSESLETMIKSLMTRSSGDAGQQSVDTLSIEEWTKQSVAFGSNVGNYSDQIIETDGYNRKRRHHLF